MSTTQIAKLIGDKVLEKYSKTLFKSIKPKNDPHKTISIMRRSSALIKPDLKNFRISRIPDFKALSLPYFNSNKEVPDSQASL
mmetsp:Transcript_4835/g.4086  ORF Transcript_4835/g.4086 Transcript_4835/m.4086 type:complete len:83 (+) Transcript_4835:19-267(+)